MSAPTCGHLRPERHLQPGRPSEAPRLPGLLSASKSGVGERVGRSANGLLVAECVWSPQTLRAVNLACLRMRGTDRAGVVSREDCFTGGLLADTADPGFLRTVLEANRHNRLLVPHQLSPVLIKSAVVWALRRQARARVGHPCGTEPDSLGTASPGARSPAGGVDIPTVHTPIGVRRTIDARSGPCRPRSGLFELGRSGGVAAIAAGRSVSAPRSLPCRHRPFWPRRYRTLTATIQAGVSHTPTTRRVLAAI